MKIILLLLCLLPAMVQAGPLALPAAPRAGFAQNLNVRLPLGAVFTDDNGAQVQLANLFRDRPVVLVLGYYQCPNLCSTLMEGVVQILAGVDLPPATYRLVEVSIDPSETAGLAARKKRSYAPMLGRHPPDMHLLTGGQAAIAQLARTAGFRYAYDKAIRQYAHPAGFLIATPRGDISHYFMGVRFEPEDVRLALIDASSGRIGSPTDRLVLLCSHFDPQTGRYSLAAMMLVRIVCLAVLATLVSGIWMHRVRQRSRR